MNIRNLIPKIGIIAFCLWHMFAVLVYSIPMDFNGNAAADIRNRLRPIAMPYLFATSQWQQWNLFSPDPLRRVTNYVLQVQQNGEWYDYGFINRRTVPWSALSREMKLLINLEGGENFEPARRELLQTYCRMMNLPIQTPLRLVYERYVLPQPPSPMSAEAWRMYKPEPEREISTEIVCRTPSAP